MRKHHITAKQYHSPLANKTARLPYEKSRKGKVSFFIFLSKEAVVFPSSRLDGAVGEGAGALPV